LVVKRYRSALAGEVIGIAVNTDKVNDLTTEFRGVWRRVLAT